MTLPVALTLGDPAGIGAEIALKAWTALRDGPPFVLIGDRAHAAAVGGQLGIPVRPVDGPEAAAAAMAGGLPVLDHPLPRAPSLGRPDPANPTRSARSC
jgi:4-hydroxythreonine-4-phosphate dehydrogenase